jgi:hypothetical protein
MFVRIALALEEHIVSTMGTCFHVSASAEKDATIIKRAG